MGESQRHAPLGKRRAGMVFRYMPATSHFDRELAAQQVREMGVLDLSRRKLHDSPIARGPDYAAAKQHLLPLSGDAAHIERIRPVLAPVCEEVIHCGPAGSAFKTKIINNYLASVSVVVNAEALALARAAGLDRDFLRRLWKRTVAGRGALETVYPGKAFARDFTPGFSARLARKDLELAQKMGQDYGVRLAPGAAARDMFTLQEEQGRIDDDWTALLDILERMAPRQGRRCGLGTSAQCHGVRRAARQS